jgi:superoxide dismutase, Cu-Zn family
MSCRNTVAIFNNRGVQGAVTFHQCKGYPYVRVSLNLTGMAPNAVHAIHIHEYGDEREGCVSLGGHWNPTGGTHGSICVPDRPRHGGDLINNIHADQNGNFSYGYNDPRLQLFGDVTSTIIGRSVVIHQGIDDLGEGGDTESLKTGNAGARMACAIIGLAKDGPYSAQ